MFNKKKPMPVSPHILIQAIGRMLEDREELQGAPGPDCSRAPRDIEKEYYAKLDKENHRLRLENSSVSNACIRLTTENKSLQRDNAALLQKHIDMCKKPTAKQGNDAVFHPAHYTPGSIEVLDFILDKKLPFCLGNVVTYICRAGLKEGTDGSQDLLKAQNYLNIHIKDVEHTGKKAYDDARESARVSASFAPLPGEYTECPVTE